jgi:hypothetical protein
MGMFERLPGIAKGIGIAIGIGIEGMRVARRT